MLACVCGVVLARENIGGEGCEENEKMKGKEWKGRWRKRELGEGNGQ